MFAQVLLVFLKIKAMQIHNFNNPLRINKLDTGSGLYRFGRLIKAFNVFEHFFQILSKVWWNTVYFEKELHRSNTVIISDIVKSGAYCPPSKQKINK